MLPSRLHAQKIDRDTNQHPRFGLLLLGMFRADPWPGTDPPPPSGLPSYTGGDGNGRCRVMRSGADPVPIKSSLAALRKS